MVESTSPNQRTDDDDAFSARLPTCTPQAHTNPVERRAERKQSNHNLFNRTDDDNAFSARLPTCTRQAHTDPLKRRLGRTQPNHVLVREGKQGECLGYSEASTEPRMSPNATNCPAAHVHEAAFSAENRIPVEWQPNIRQNEPKLVLERRHVRLLMAGLAKHCGEKLSESAQTADLLSPPSERSLPSFYTSMHLRWPGDVAGAKSTSASGCTTGG
ncbi:hypothetical protein PHSY_002495 [Pseudozyma hubeiensis SY62]|uniref:Uncharacterized protein n=1 Tax=Pseudozyma hubeiensis (strain SY62) TaxID=1305764 RepID=R9P1D8_PSEHS|nr:hypothetical protein PHSY_002495 [Pseudozyma hubeiensis SY62]GAC94922.1 hypothetical protein PHSY_002495 [Pseudozyma hubeiensis SY62]